MCSRLEVEKLAPPLLASEFTTARLPCATSTSVTDAPMDWRLEIASMCAWLLLRTLAIRVSSSSRVDPSSIGRATSIASSKASLWITLTGAPSKRASRSESWARTSTSISSASRPITLPKVSTSSSL